MNIEEVRSIVKEFDTSNALIRTIRSYCLEQLDMAERAKSPEQVYEHLLQVERLIDVALDKSSEDRHSGLLSRRRLDRISRGHVPTSREVDLVRIKELLANLTSRESLAELIERILEMPTKNMMMNALKNVVVKDAYAVIVIDGETGDLTIFSDITPKKAELMMVLDNGMEDYE